MGGGYQGHVLPLRNLHIFLRLASLVGGPRAHVHMKGMKCRVLYLCTRHECSVL